MDASLHRLELKIGYLMQNGAPNLGEVSGPQLHTTAIINGLKKLGHTVRVVAFQKGKLGWSEDILEWQTPRYGPTSNTLFRLIESVVRRLQTELKLPFLGLFDSLRYADACCHHLDGFDILYERHGYMGFGGVIAARWLGIPLILELNGNIIKEIDKRRLSITPLQRNIGKWITKQTLLAADGVIVVSEALRQTLVNEYQIPATKVSVVINGVDVELFSRKYERAAIQSQFHLSSGPIIGFVGTFEPWHGVDLLVSSFRIVERKHTDAQLVIIGDGPAKEKAIALAKEYGLGDKIRFLGRLPQTQVAAILSISKVLVAPYPFQNGDIVGTPLKIMEYMAAGKGIVASTAPLHELIENGKTGLRVSPASEQALADGINNLLENDELCSFMEKNAKLQANKFSWDNVSMELEQIFVEKYLKKSRRLTRKKLSNRLWNNAK
jgi:glycosyltransferase involved in cell wall biosynthesis